VRKQEGVIMLRSDYFTRKNYFTEKNEHCAIFIRAHFMWGLRLGLGLSWGVRVRVGVR